MLLTARVPVLELTSADLILGFGEATDLHWEVFGLELQRDGKRVVAVTVHFELPDRTEDEHLFTDVSELVTVQIPRSQTKFSERHGAAA